MADATAGGSAPRGYTFRVYDDRGQLHWERPLVERRCAFRGTARGRCGWRTSLVHPFCRRCLPSALRVALRRSGLRGAGLGLFACDLELRNGAPVFARGERIAPYLGEDVTQRTLERRYFSAVADPAVDVVRTPYVAGGKGRHVDAAVLRGPGAYANDGAYSGHASNSVLRTDDDGTVWLSATRTVRNGDEIFVRYGDAYWTGYPLRYETVPA